MERDLLAAASHFRRTATELANRVALFNGVDPAQLWDECSSLEWRIPDSEWSLDLHGQHCMFTHQVTGQVVEVSLWFGAEFGVLDPYFFYDYMRTTPDLELPAGLRQPFHDTARAMSFLEERGLLTRVERGLGSGLTAR